MDRFFTAVRVAGRAACLALAGAGLFAASTHHAACAAWLAVGLFSLWYIGQTLLALSAPLLVRAQVAAAVRDGVDASSAASECAKVELS